MKQRIFVYGTLKRGGEYSRFMSGQEFLGEAWTEPNYRMIDCGGYPGMFPVERHGQSIHGEVWLVDDQCLRRLDELEDVAGGEYAFARIPLLPPHDAEFVHGYLYRRETEHLSDAGTDWPV